MLKELTQAITKRNSETGEKEMVLTIENSTEDRMTMLKQLTRLKNALEEAGHQVKNSE